MPWIKFLTDHKVRAADGKGPTYAAGQPVEMSAESCAHFTSRGLAVDLPDGPPKAGEAAGESEGGKGDGGPPAVPPPPPKGGKGGKPATQ